MSSEPGDRTKWVSLLLAPPSALPDLLWLLSDILAGVAAGYALRQAQQAGYVGG